MTNTLKDNYKLMINECIQLESEMQKVDKINEWFNVNIEYGNDIFIWGLKEYWATLDETLEKGCGDCDDIAIAKYFALKELGIKTQLAYVTSRDGAHMICVYNGWKLDNNTDYLTENGSILKELLFSREIIYTFDEDILKSGNKAVPARLYLSQWDGLLNRMENVA